MIFNTNFYEFLIYITIFISSSAYFSILSQLINLSHLFTLFHLFLYTLLYLSPISGNIARLLHLIHCSQLYYTEGNEKLDEGIKD